MKPHDLPIYRSAQLLLTQLVDSTRQTTRELRVTLVPTLIRSAAEICALIVQANRATEERKEIIDKVRKEVARTEALANALFNCNGISTGGYAKVVDHLDSAGRQATGWFKTTK